MVFPLSVKVNDGLLSENPERIQSGLPEKRMEEIQNYLFHLDKDEAYENPYRCLQFFVLSENPAFSGIICLVDSPEIVFFQNLEKLADPCFGKNIRQTKTNLESRLLDKFILSNLFIRSIESNNSAFSTLIPLSKRFLLCDIYFLFLQAKKFNVLWLIR